MSQNNGNATVATIPNAPYHPRYTGEELKNLRPADYRKVVELLAEPREQVTIRQIADICHVDRRTVAAVERNEAQGIAAAKSTLMRKAARVAHKAIDRVEDQIDTANITQATIAFGVATEKMLLLAGEATAILEVNPGPGFADLYDKLNSLKPGNAPKTIEATVVDEAKG